MKEENGKEITSRQFSKKLFKTPLCKNIFERP